MLIPCLQLMDLGLLHGTKKFLSSNFKMKDMGEASRKNAKQSIVVASTMEANMLRLQFMIIGYKNLCLELSTILPSC
ncbi:hypothetical protein CR513_19573, partial [Mucuna pruriens]